MFGIKQATVGMEISHNGVGCVLLRHGAEKPVLERAQRYHFTDGLLSSGFREPQVCRPEEFVRGVQDAWNLLLVKDRRVALSLPDAAGRLFLLELDEQWRDPGEATEILRWKLARKLGLEPELLQLVVQRFTAREAEGGGFLVAVSLKTVIRQYEELLQQAGLEPVRVGLHSLQLFNLFGRVTAGEGSLVLRYDQSLGVCIMADGLPLVCRTRAVAAGSVGVAEIARELSGSWQLAGKQRAGGLPGSIWCGDFSGEEPGLSVLLQETVGHRSSSLSLAAVVDGGAGMSSPCHAAVAAALELF